MHTRIEFSRVLYKCLAIPWAGVLLIDIANGPIYVVNEDLLYGAEKIEGEK